MPVIRTAKARAAKGAAVMWMGTVPVMVRVRILPFWVKFIA